MRDVDTSTGIVKATVLAGPVFLLVTALGSALTGHAPVVLRPEYALAPLLLAIATIPGSVLGLVPVLIGTRVLAALGRGNPGVRHPAMWGLAGAGAAAAVLSAADADPGFAAIMTATGTICALLARSGVRWSD